MPRGGRRSAHITARGRKKLTGYLRAGRGGQRAEANAPIYPKRDAQRAKESHQPDAAMICVQAGFR